MEGSEFDLVLVRNSFVWVGSHFCMFSTIALEGRATAELTPGADWILHALSSVLILPILNACDNHIRGGMMNHIQRKRIDSLLEEFKFNDEMTLKIAEMKNSYDGWWPVRGDGNCYYRYT